MDEVLSSEWAAAADRKSVSTPLFCTRSVCLNTLGLDSGESPGAEERNSHTYTPPPFPAYVFPQPLRKRTVHLDCLFASLFRQEYKLHEGRQCFLFAHCSVSSAYDSAWLGVAAPWTSDGEQPIIAF